jgi:hypothetical protein
MDKKIEARRGYINSVGDYIPFEKDQSSGWREGRKSESSVYIPPAMKKRQAENEAMLKKLDEEERKYREIEKKYLKEATPEELLYRDIYTARKKKESISKHFPQTGTRSDEGKGFFSGIYDKTVGEYQRGRDEKERLKEKTKEAMVAEPDPFVKKEIASEIKKKRAKEYNDFLSGEGSTNIARDSVMGGLDEVGPDALKVINRNKEYQGFLDGAALNAQERARRGQPIVDQKTGRLEDLGTEALPVDMGDVEQQMAEGMAQDEEERAVNEDLAMPSQEQAQESIRSLPQEEQDQVSAIVAEKKGLGSEEWIETKEATGRYVRYQGSGLVINMASLEKDIKRKENMDMLKHIPAANRAAMLVQWGYIDPGDLSVAQKQSAKEIKEDKILDLKIAGLESNINKNKKALSPTDKIAYETTYRAMLQASKDGDYELSETHRLTLNKIVPGTDTSNYSVLNEKKIQQGKKQTLSGLFKQSGLTNGESYYRSRLKITEDLNLFREKKTSQKDFLNIVVADGEEKGSTFGDILKRNGVFTWDKVENVKNIPGVPKAALRNEEAYMNWSIGVIKEKLLHGIWGPLHSRVINFNRKQESIKLKENQDILNNPAGTVDPGLQQAVDTEKKNKKQVETNQKKIRTKKEKEDKLFNEITEENKFESRTVGRFKSKRTKKEIYAVAMKKGEESLRKKYLTKTSRRSGRVSKVEEARFKSLQEAIKYFKDPKNAKELEDESASFRHFISKSK